MPLPVLPADPALRYTTKAPRPRIITTTAVWVSPAPGSFEKNGADYRLRPYGCDADISEVCRSA